MRQGFQKIILVTLIFSFLAGCGTKEQTERTYNSRLEQRIEEIVLENREVFDVKTAEDAHEIIVALKVQHLQRFNKDKITRRIEKELKNIYPERELIVSSDYKIFLELSRLQESNEGQKDNYSKIFKKIVKLSTEET